MTDDIVKQLGEFDSCAISDALDQLGLPPSVTGLLPLTTAKRIFGQLITVRLAEGTAPVGAPARHLCTAAIDQANAGDVIVVEQRTGIECAGWGGILSNAAHYKRLSGVIVDGPARDIDEAIEIGFPILARNATARTARGRIHEAETGRPIRVGTTTVDSGDYVVADSSGAAFIPAAHIHVVIEAATRIATREGAMTRAVLDGQPVSSVMGASYEHLLETGKPA